MKKPPFENLILLRAIEVAQVLKISRASAYRLIQQGTIPSVRINHAVRVRSCDLEAFIQKNWFGWGEPSEPDPC
jgi:excisionase family DNA binding protein